MSINDIYDDDGFSDFLGLLIDMGHLEGAALGITKQVIDQGEDSLSSKQKFVFKNQVLEPHTVSECSRCGSNVPWSEMYDAAMEHGLCNYCWHMTTKDD
ncbi:hypothetical protein [Vibrio parahaemolyticus]|uniref:hypothetical protein n=1 Tax=Vibrio parahaemolyticus TaxID=670 RepID=UPI0007DC1197|nr:hypothetical protein [Vibrio parahaemolyticus]HDY7424755.1 hypothetical protein [Vibrio vulnificus]AVW95428.1 hypothetical protein DA442_09905 [Vibrio parahaemolyticus]EGQ8739651.1 hypothetical protein [Vibrio parahaemolyticus]EGQ8907687.1 hypothetical protein [Vibrio parahaemolyticus]EGR3102019.1 hypothetical protein [Vibrio parahaemolyticus]